MTEKTPTAPPDKDAEIAMLKMRVHAAEAALYAMETHIREDLLEKFVQPIVKQMHALNAQYPLQDDTPDGAKKIALDALRASMPEMKDKTDDEIVQLYFREPKK